jgi:hypothetical protein
MLALGSRLSRRLVLLSITLSTFFVLAIFSRNAAVDSEKINNPLTSIPDQPVMHMPPGIIIDPIERNNSIPDKSVLSNLNPRILIGVITILEKVDRRAFLRDFYKTRLTAPNIDVVFVIARQETPEKIAQLAAEQARFNDIMLLEETTENMNGGKTYYFFKHAYESLIDTPYAFIMKTDDDSLIHLPHLTHRFATLPLQSLYWGREWYNYMGGTGVLSPILIPRLCNHMGRCKMDRHIRIPKEPPQRLRGPNHRLLDVGNVWQG